LSLHRSESGCSPSGEGGLPSDLFDFACYEQVALRLAPGDVILFATDGLSEAADEHGEQFGMARLIDLCAQLDYRAPDVLLRSIFDSIEQFTGGRPTDTMTALVLKAGSRFASKTDPSHEFSEEWVLRKDLACLIPSETQRPAMHRLLIIDDDESMRKLLRLQLKDSYEIIGTADSQEGVALALPAQPDAILLDLMMPTYSGLEICQTLASLSFTQRIPIFIVAGESAARYQDFCLNHGAKGFFQKPVAFDKLRRKLTEAVSTWRQTKISSSEQRKSCMSSGRERRAKHATSNSWKNPSIGFCLNNAEAHRSGHLSGSSSCRGRRNSRRGAAPRPGEGG
jgi:CheY-like chemotaxis protein